MHSSKMCTVRCSGRLSCHARPSPATYAPPPPCTPLSCMPPFATHAPVDRMTDACENITFPQLLLGTVKKIFLTFSPRPSCCFRGSSENTNPLILSQSAFMPCGSSSYALLFKMSFSIFSWK